jgi:hypothetical protein
MYIKYEGNIHNLKRYFSYIRSGDIYIHLLRKDNSYLSLSFENKFLREKVLELIFKNLHKKQRTLDLDKEIELLKSTDKYNL